MKRVKQWFKLIAVLLLAILGCHTIVVDVQAQEQSLRWSPQQRIPGYLDRTEPPILIADSMGLVHAFAYQQVGDPDEGRQIAIIYSTWTLESGWTLPVDIIMSPTRNQARVMDVYLDPQDYFHLVFYGGDEQGANLFYATAHATQARSAFSWSKPVVIGSRPLTPSLARMVGDGKGNLLVVYSANLDGPGLFLIRSADGGESWSSPEPFFLTYDGSHRPFILDMSWGEADRLHMVWHLVDSRGHNVGAYYAQKDAQLDNWTNPIIIDEGIGVEEGMGVANPTVIEHEGQIIVGYNNGIPPNGVPPTNWVRVSRDNGQTWTERMRISSDHVGRNGVLSFVVDSSNQLYIFFALRIPTGGASAIAGMWYSVWQDQQWSRTEAVVSRTDAAVARLQREGGAFNPYDARAVTSLGNKVLVTWRTDPGNPRPGVWYSYTLLDTLAVDPISLNEPDNALLANRPLTENGEMFTLETSSTTTSPTPVPSFVMVEGDEEIGEQTSTASVLYRSVIPAVTLIISVIAANFWRHSRRT